jgi:hypothetical protein
LRRQFSRFAKQLVPTGMLWVSWPKKSSGVATDLAENDVRSIGLEAGLVDTKVCAVSEVWSGLKFVYRLRLGRCAEVIQFRTSLACQISTGICGKPCGNSAFTDCKVVNKLTLRHFTHLYGVT